MPLYMDRHELHGVTAADVAGAHAADLAVAGAYGVEFLTYWFDPDRGTAFCLARAGQGADVQAVHAASHGLVPNEVIEVGEADVLRFLGRVRDPAGDAVGAAFRVVVFTDLEGSTGLLTRLGEAAYLGLLGEHDRLVRQALADHRGREVKHTGDGFMAAFDGVAPALRCALAIQAAFATRPAAGPGLDMRVRIGISSGEPVNRDDDLFGRTVHLAARTCAAAKGGETLVTQDVFSHRDAAAFQFGPVTDVSLRGFAEPVALAALLGADHERAVG